MLALLALALVLVSALTACALDNVIARPADTAPCSDGAPLGLPSTGPDWVGPSASLEQHLDMAELVVVGRVIGVWTPEGHLLARRLPRPLADPPDGVTRARGGATYFAVEVQESLVDEAPALLLMQHLGDWRRASWHAEWPPPAFNEPMLLFLNPWANVWQSRAGWGRMCEVVGSMYYQWAWEEPYEVPYFAGMTLAEAVDEVRRVASELGR